MIYLLDTHSLLWAIADRARFVDFSFLLSRFLLFQYLTVPSALNPLSTGDTDDLRQRVNDLQAGRFEMSLVVRSDCVAMKKGCSGNATADQCRSGSSFERQLMAFRRADGVRTVGELLEQPNGAAPLSGVRRENDAVFAIAQGTDLH